MKRTLALTPDMTKRLREAVARSALETVGDAMRQAIVDWEVAEAHRERSRGELQQAIAVGLADIDAGRVTGFDADAIIAEGRERSARSASG